MGDRYTHALGDDGNAHRWRESGEEHATRVCDGAQAVQLEAAPKGAPRCGECYDGKGGG